MVAQKMPDEKASLAQLRLLVSDLHYLGVSVLYHVGPYYWRDNSRSARVVWWQKVAFRAMASGSGAQFGRKRNARMDTQAKGTPHLAKASPDTGWGKKAAGVGA